MSKLASIVTGAFWPEVETERGNVRARALAASAVFWTYFFCNFDVLFGPISDASPGQASFDYLIALTGLGAAAYLAMRIQISNCAIAAWAAFLWLGYQAIDAFMEATLFVALMLCLICFFSFQGLRASPNPLTRDIVPSADHPDPGDL